MNIKNRKNSVKEALKSLHSKGESMGDRPSAIERMQKIFDEGSFIETNAFITESKSLFVDEKSFPEAIVTGYGAIDGGLVFAFAQDYSRSKGAFGLKAAKKIENLYKMALENGAPVIGVFDSDGAKLQEGTDALSAYGIALKSASKAAHKIPRISIVAGNCIGANAVLALESDFVISAGDISSISLMPSSVLQNIIEGEGKASETDNIKSNLACFEAISEAEAFLAARNILKFIPPNKKAKLKPVSNGDRADRLINKEINAGQTDMRALLLELSDNGSFFEVGKGHAKSIITGFAFIDGISCAVLSTNPQKNKGKITAMGAKKAHEFIDFCNAFSIPLISLLDSEGYDENSELKNPDFAKHISKLASSFACASMPTISAILGKASGSIFSFFGSKSLGTDIVLALDTSEIEVMETEAAINFMFNQDMAKSNDAGAIRTELKEKWEQEMSTPLNAAKNGYVDFIFESSELRARLASALNMLSAKLEFSDLL